MAIVTCATSVGEMVDGHFLVSWNDGDQGVPTGTATVDLFYTNVIPPTFVPGDVPAELEGMPIVLGVREVDRANTYVWDTSGVPTGSYWIWSRVNEPPTIPPKRTIISFSKGVVTVAHPGDPVPPAVHFLPPASPFLWPESDRIEIDYEGFDPDGASRVTLEAGPSASALTVLAEGLPASHRHRFTWATLDWPEGQYVVRATITDGSGRSFSAYDQFFRIVNNPEPDTEAGGCTAVPSDASLWVLALLAAAKRRR